MINLQSHNGISVGDHIRITDQKALKMRIEDSLPVSGTVVAIYTFEGEPTVWVDFKDCHRSDVTNAAHVEKVEQKAMRWRK